MMLYYSIGDTVYSTVRECYGTVIGLDNYGFARVEWCDPYKGERSWVFTFTLKNLSRDDEGVRH